VIYYIYRGKWFYGKMPPPPYYAPVWMNEDGDGTLYQNGDKSKDWRMVPGIVISQKPAVNERKSKDRGRLPDNARHSKRGDDGRKDDYKLEGRDD
jgi:hypothetical protein